MPRSAIAGHTRKRLRRGRAAESKDYERSSRDRWGLGAGGRAGIRSRPTGCQVINTWTNKQLELSHRSCDGAYTCVRLTVLRQVFGQGLGIACEKFHKR